MDEYPQFRTLILSLSLSLSSLSFTLSDFSKSQVKEGLWNFSKF